MDTPDTTTAPEAPVAIPEEARQLVTTSDELISRAEQIEVANPENAKVAGAMLTSLAGRRKAIEEERFKITRPLDEAKKRAMEWFKPAIEKLQTAEAIVRRKLTGFLEEEERQRKAAEAKAAEAARKEAERLAKRAETAEAKGKVEEAAVLRELADAPAPVIAAPATRVSGISSRENWSAQVTDKAALVKAAAENPAYLAYLEPDMKSLNALARAQKNALAIPGVKAVNQAGLSVRGRSF